MESPVSGQGARGAQKSNVSLPDSSRELCESQSFLSEINKVARHYDVSCCFLALESPEGMYLKARYGLEEMGDNFLPHPTSGELMCRHAIKRALPIIVEDTDATEHLKKDPLVGRGIRFYAGAPLMMTDSTCVGTLCIADTKPRPGFGLLDTPELENHASKVAKLLMAAAKRRSLAWEAWTVGSLSSLQLTTSGNYPQVALSQDSLDSVSVNSNDDEAENCSSNRDDQLRKIVERTAVHYGVPCSFIALDSAEGMTIEAGFGLRTSLDFLPHLPTGNLMCRSIVNRRVPIIIADTASTATFRNDPLVAGDEGARFYAGAPIIASGAILGTLCIIDRIPRLDFDLDSACEMEASAEEISQLLDPISMQQRSSLVRECGSAGDDIQQASRSAGNGGYAR
eukprot:TRINITY_DN48974_c0_g1_i1.p1 TRINITY_DN48974_c0_g1~~TRINITY_DN48974_c0_g1_i1.p1  ORF type:complete len:397 (-),score=61.83 TRINITY_DN48974_c0_g1_i1:131-1321(-)